MENHAILESIRRRRVEYLTETVDRLEREIRSKKKAKRVDEFDIGWNLGLEMALKTIRKNNTVISAREAREEMNAC